MIKYVPLDVVCVIHASLVHLLTMVNTTAWLFPTIALFGTLILGIFIYHSLIKHPPGNLEGLLTPALSLTLELTTLQDRPGGV